MARLAEFQINDVYPLYGAGIADGLYRTEFNYRQSHWTDYSAKRAEPLMVSTELAVTEERAMALALKQLDKGLTKGFEPVNAGCAAAGTL